MTNSTILVVDDEPGVGMIFSKILAEEGQSTHHFTSAEDGLSFIQSEPSIRLVFLDIRLPGMDGMEALSKFLNINPSLNIVMMTAYQTVESVVTAMKVGAVDYLVKPLDPKMVIQAVQKYGKKAEPKTSKYLSLSSVKSKAPFSGIVVLPLPESRRTGTAMPSQQATNSNYRTR